jgi:hypothetical protein
MVQDRIGCDKVESAIWNFAERFAVDPVGGDVFPPMPLLDQPQEGG